jgi:hypothetical protein
MSSTPLRSSMRVAVVLAVAALGPAIAYAQVRAVRPPVVRDFASEVGCGVSVAAAQPASSIRIAPGTQQDKHGFAPGDPVILDAGSTKGLKVGQEYFVRRTIPDPFTEVRSDGMPSLTVHTAGWVRLVEVLPESAIATITHACDAMEMGDYLEPFEMPVVPPQATAGEPDFSNPGRVVLGDDRRQTAAPGDMVVLDRGSDHGVRPGQRLTFFRRTFSKGGPNLKIGQGTAMSVSPDTTIVRVDTSTSAVFVGDFVALHR